MLDISNEDAIINFEIYAEQQEINDRSNIKFKELLLAIIASIQLGEPLKKTKQLIYKSNVNGDTKEKLEKLINDQNEIITGKKTKLNLNELIFAGYTFIELIEQRKQTTLKQAIRFMVQAQNIIEEEKGLVGQIIDDEINRYNNTMENFYRTQAKSAREFGYAQIEKTFITEIKGWISLAILDNNTSPICLSLHNQYYEKGKQYQTRFDLPYQIPRHPKCRSQFVAVFKNRSIQSYKGKNLETFLMKNEETGKDLLGIEKYRLFKEKDIKLNNFVDIKGKRFYTNKEIKKRLNIK